MPYEEFARPRSGYTVGPRGFRAPCVSHYPQGVFRLNKQADALLGRPERVVLLIDRAERVVAIRPADGEDDHAVRVLRDRRGDGAGGRIMSTAFCGHYGLTTPLTRHYPARLEGGILQFDV